MFPVELHLSSMLGRIEREARAVASMRNAHPFRFGAARPNVDCAVEPLDTTAANWIWNGNDDGDGDDGIRTPKQPQRKCA